MLLNTLVLYMHGTLRLRRFTGKNTQKNVDEQKQNYQKNKNYVSRIK